MKTRYALFLAILSAATTQAMASVTPSIWVRPAEQKVYFVPASRLHVKLTHLGADDEYWDQLDVSLLQDPESVKQQMAFISGKYPGMMLQKVVAESKGIWTLRIPSIGKSESLTPTPGQEGPYVNLTYFIPKAQSVALRSALKRSEAGGLSMEGQIVGNAPDNRVVEKIELDTSVCETLTAQGKTLYHVLRAFPAVEKQIDSRSYRFASTREKLKRSVLESCIEMQPERETRSFKELLATEVAAPSNPSRPYGETRMIAPVQEAIPLKYELVVQISAEEAP